MPINNINNEFIHAVNETINDFTEGFSELPEVIKNIFLFFIMIFLLFFVIKNIYQCYNICSYYTKKLYNRCKENRYTESTNIEL